MNIINVKSGFSQLLIYSSVTGKNSCPLSNCVLKVFQTLYCQDRFCNKVTSCQSDDWDSIPNRSLSCFQIHHDHPSHPMGAGDSFSLGLKWPLDQSCTASKKVKNAWNLTSIPLYIMAYSDTEATLHFIFSLHSYMFRHIKRDNLILLLNYKA